MQFNQAPTKTLQASFPGRDLHVSYFCFCFDNIGLYFYVLLTWFTHTPNIGVLCYNSGFDVEISSSKTPPRALYRIILSESNDKT
jgi:hypothetical protein